MSKLQARPFTVLELYQLLSRTISSDTEFANLHVLDLTMELVYDMQQVSQLPPKLIATCTTFYDTLEGRLILAELYAREQKLAKTEPTHPAPENLQ